MLLDVLDPLLVLACYRLLSLLSSLQKNFCIYAYFNVFLSSIFQYVGP